MSLKTLSIIAATLLLVIAATGTGYLAARNNGSDNSDRAGDGSDLSPTKSKSSTPPPFTQVGSRLEFFNGDEVCRMDVEARRVECAYAKGVKQVISFDNEKSMTLQTKTASDASDSSDSCREEIIPLDGVAPPSVGEAGIIGESNINAEDLIEFVSKTKRVNSWLIRVPKALTALGGDESGMDEFTYFEKDGQPWKIEAFERDAKDPMVVRFSTPNTDSDPAWRVESMSETCVEAKSEGGNLRGDRRKLLAFTTFFAGVVMAAAIIASLSMMIPAWCMMCSQAGRRRRLRVGRGSAEMAFVKSLEGIHTVVSGAAMTMATAAAAAAGSSVPATIAMS